MAEANLMSIPITPVLLSVNEKNFLSKGIFHIVFQD